MSTRSDLSSRKEIEARKRSYAQFCPLARALDVVGERWTLLLIRNLLVGPLRYSELLEGLPGLTTNLLAKRLKEMTAHGLLETKERHGITLYQLTERAQALEPALFALSRWGEDEPFPDGGHRDLRWAMLGLRRRYRGGVELRLSIVCRAPDVTFNLYVEDEEIRFVEDFDEGVEATIEGEQMAIFALLYGKKRLAQLKKAGSLEIIGKRKLIAEFLDAAAP